MITSSDYRPGLLRRTRVTDWLSFLIAAGFALVGIAMAALAGSPIAVVLPFGAAAITVLLWQRPHSIIYFLLSGAVLIEVYPSNQPDQTFGLIPLWRNMTTSGLAPIPFSPAELLMVAGVAIWVLRGVFYRNIEIRGSDALKPYGLFLAAVLVALVHGIAVGGVVTIALLEVRIWFYCALVFLLILNLLHPHRHINVLAWLILLATGYRAFQGVWRYYVTLGGQFDGNALLSHEEALIFPAYVIWVALSFTFGAPRRQKQVGLLLLPMVLIADFVNNRRASTGTLLICIVAAAFILFTVLKEHRLRLLQGTLVMIVILTVYLSAFWNSTSVIAQPAQAIKSQIEPTERDESSDRYRELEDQALRDEIRKRPLLGQGFGIEMPLAPGMADIRNISPLMLYMPHNTILYIWWRTGIIGFTLLWTMFGAAIIRNCFLARATDDPLIKRWAIFAVCVTLMSLLIAWWDLGLLSYRTVVYTWTMLAVPEVLRRQAGSANVPASK